MKTFAKYILAIGLLALAVSCENPLATKDFSDADQVEVTLSVVFPEPVPVPTKGAMGEGPESTAFDIHLCVYGSGDGYVQNWTHTTLFDTETDSNGYVTKGKFKALLPIAHDKRIIHIIANPPKAVTDPYVITYMELLMEKMVTKLGTDDECSYWQQILVDEIAAGDHESSTPGIPVASDEVLLAFKDIHLVRNFSKVIVTSATETDTDYKGFVVNRWTLINVPDQAYVAPYTGIDTDDDRFPSGYLNIKDYLTGNTLYTQLTDVDKYPGSLPPEAEIDETFPADLTKYAVRGGAQYMYERPLPTSEQKQTAVLVEVVFDAAHDPGSRADHTYWYKIEILNQAGEYVPFLRDIVYQMKIEGLEGEGAASAEAAFNGPYFGNISASLETAGLNEISDGKSLIHVDLMDFTFMAGSTSEQTLTEILMNGDLPSRFYFIPDINATPVSQYTGSTSGICDIKVELLEAEGYDPAVTACAPDYTQGTITVTLAESSSTEIKRSIIRVSGRKGDDVATNSNKYIYREITVTLMEKQDLKHGDDVTRITNTPTLTGAGNPVNFQVCLPEGLSASVFPVQIRIEAENNSLTARTYDLPVKTGASVFDSNAGKNTYFFIYTINFSDYRKLNPVTKKYEYTYNFDFTMYTSKSGDNSTDIDLRDLGGKFKPTTLTLPVTNP